MCNWTLVTGGAATVLFLLGWYLHSLTYMLPGDVRTFKDLARFVAAYIGGRGRCVCCGYRLIGNVSGVCPECGNLVQYGTAT